MQDQDRIKTRVPGKIAFEELAMHHSLCIVV